MQAQSVLSTVLPKQTGNDRDPFATSARTKEAPREDTGKSDFARMIDRQADARRAEIRRQDDRRSEDARTDAAASDRPADTARTGTETGSTRDAVAAREPANTGNEQSDNKATDTDKPAEVADDDSQNARKTGTGADDAPAATDTASTDTANDNAATTDSAAAETAVDNPATAQTAAKGAGTAATETASTSAETSSRVAGSAARPTGDKADAGNSIGTSGAQNRPAQPVQNQTAGGQQVAGTGEAAGSKTDPAIDPTAGVTDDVPADDGEVRSLALGANGAANAGKAAANAVSGQAVAQAGSQGQAAGQAGDAGSATASAAGGNQSGAASATASGAAARADADFAALVGKQTAGDAALSQGTGQNNTTTQTATAAPVQPTAPASAQATIQAATAAAPHSAAMAQNAEAPAQQVAVHVTRAAKEGADRIEIQLKPAELGRVDVKLEVGHDGRVTAVVSADRADTLDALRRDTQSLEKALTNAGFNTDSNSFTFAGREQGSERFARGDGRGGFGTGDDGAEAETAPDPAVASRRIAMDHLGVDMTV